MWHRKKSESFCSSLQGNYRWVSINAGTVHFSRKCLLVWIQTPECKSKTILSTFYIDSNCLFDQQNYCQTTCQILCLLKWREMYPNAYMDIRNKSKYVFGERKLKYLNWKVNPFVYNRKIYIQGHLNPLQSECMKNKKSLKIVKLNETVRSKVEKNMNYCSVKLKNL